MFEISKCVELDAGHRVPYHNAKCRNLHGHRYRVTLFVTADGLVPPEPGVSDAGMVTDFGVLKQVLMEQVHDPYDHKLILWKGDPLVTSGPFQDALVGVLGLEAGVVLVPCIPTAEELARLWGERIRDVLRANDVTDLQVTRLEVRETPTSIATWFNDEGTT